MYADKMTKSMERTIDETNRRREIQKAYNEEHGITPTALNKSNESAFLYRSAEDEDEESTQLAADPVVSSMSEEQLQKSIKKTEKDMKKAAKELDFIEAARLRDEMYKLQKLLEQKQ
jgi:excinuclease ABC subunit B